MKTVGPSGNGSGHSIKRCGTYSDQIFSNFETIGTDKILVFRTTTLDKTDQYPSQAHVFTCGKLPWVELGSTIPSFKKFYDRKKICYQRSLVRSAKIE